jgi:hypothetical protein
MLVASLDAISGSVIRNAERMFPFNNGSNQLFFCETSPNLARTSMFPVSGAEEFITYHRIHLACKHGYSVEIVRAHLACNMTLPKLLGHKAIFQVAVSGTFAVVPFGQEQIPETSFLRLQFQVLQDLWVGSETTLDLTTKLLSENSVCGDTLLLHKAFNL